MRWATLLFLGLAGCMVGPNYKAPEIAMPEKFKEEVTPQEAEGNLCAWWKQLNDPMLDELLAEAVEGNFDLKNAIERIYQARAEYRIERSHLFPEINISATATRSLFSKNFFGPSNVDNTSGRADSPFSNFFQLGFDAIWEFDVWGKFRRSKNASYNIWEATKDEAESVLISTLSEVAHEYVTIRALQQKLDLAREKVGVDERELVLSDDLFQAGLSFEQDVDLSVASLESDRAEIPVIKTALKKSIYAMAVLLGKQPESMVERFKEKRGIPSGIAKVPVGLPSDLLRRRPDVRQAERQLASATEMVGAAVADLFPHISLTGTTFAGGSDMGSVAGLESSHLNNLFRAGSRYWSVGPGIMWNLIDFGRVRATIKVKKSLQKQALTSYEKAVVASLKDVEGALVAYFEEQKRNRMLASQVEAEARAFELAEDLFRAGLSSEFEVLEAKHSLIVAKEAAIDSDQAVTSNLIALYKALGGEWECSSSP
jgi:multidrug efflux system outer membrane protein